VLKISKKLEWTREYIQLVRHLVPRIRYLKRITSKVPDKDSNYIPRNQHIHGILTHYKDEKHYRMTLYTKYLSVTKIDPLEFKIRPYSKIDLLEFLAHELSHLKYWDHTPDHARLQSELMLIFMIQLKNSGYKSYEDEMSFRSKCKK